MTDSLKTWPKEVYQTRVDVLRLGDAQLHRAESEGKAAKFIASLEVGLAKRNLRRSSIKSARAVKGR